MAGPGFAEDKGAPYALPQDLIGVLKTFGEFGPAYEVLRIIDETEAWIIVPESGEELAYPISEILKDPEAS